MRQRKVIFLDRDGVINKKMAEGDYVKRWDEFQFLPGVTDALKLLAQNDCEIFIITNQRGIALGRLSEDDLGNIHANMQFFLAAHGVKISDIYYCPHDKDACECRKPKPGMLLQAAREHSIDFSEAVLIGDSASDIAAGKAAGCKTLLVDSKKNLLQAVQELFAEKI